MSSLSIIILQHNSPTETERCLASLQEAWLPDNTEVIVVNNGSNQANEKINKSAHEKLNIQFFDIPNNGYPQGNNFGYQHATGNMIAVVNPDIIVEHDTFKILLDYLNQHPQVGIVAPRLIYPDSTVQDNYRVFPRFIDLVIKRTPLLRSMFPQRMRRYLMWDKEPSVNEPVDWVTGAFEIVRRDVLEKLGGHDERYFLFMSDVVICREAWKNGFEVHFVGQAKAHHNDERLSSGGFMALFKKKVLRIHVKDAARYYWHYLTQPIPQNVPSLSHVEQKDRLLKARYLSGTSALTKLKGKLQRKNPVVTVFKGLIRGHKNYEQPVIFFDTGVVGIVRNQSGHIGLMTIWRHIPLSFTKKNTFPVFPEVSHLGMWSLECPRGGIEKKDKSPQEAVKRELFEEIGLSEKDIVSIRPLGHVVGNTAIDVYHHKCFEVIVSDNFHFSTDEKIETIKGFAFYTPDQIAEFIKSKQLFCGISQAAVLQALKT